MKKTLYLLAFAAVLAGCGKDEEWVNYSEQSGYLTDVYSVKYGLSGFWQGDDEYTIKCDQYGSISASFLSQGYLISSYNIIYDVYKEKDVFILKIKNIQRQGLYSPSGKIPELKELLEKLIKSLELETNKIETNKNKIIDLQHKISYINEQIERLEYVVNLMNTHNQKQIPDFHNFAIIKLDKTTCIVEVINIDEFTGTVEEFTGERYVRTKIK
jgi:hypothetical protein